MSEKAKQTHKNFCDYEIAKAKSSRLLSVREPQRKPIGIKTANVSKAMLAIQLASLF